MSLRVVKVKFSKRKNDSVVFSLWKILVCVETPYVFFRIYILLIGRRVSVIAIIAASPQSSSTLILGPPVVPWVSCRYLDVIIWIYVCQKDF